MPTRVFSRIRGRRGVLIEDSVTIYYMIQKKIYVPHDIKKWYV